MPRFNKLRQPDAVLWQFQDQPEKCRFGAAP